MRQLTIKASLYILAIIGFTACKKGAINLDPDSGTTANVIEFANTGDDVGGFAVSKYPRFATDLGSLAAGATGKFNVNVSYSGKDVAPQDITVTLALDTAALNLFNTQNNTNYKTPPTAIYSVPTTAVIKKGDHHATIEVTITNNASFDFNVSYALPLAIKSTSYGIISGNYGKAIYSFAARNNLDGIYLMEATAPMVDVTNATLTGWYPINMQLITYTGNSIALYDGINYVSAYGHPIKSGTSGSYYGSFSPVFFFDATGKITSITNYYGQESSANKRSAVLDATGVNKATFNPNGTIKSFEVSYIMTQSNVTPYAPRTYFKEKFTYVEPR
jgi:hypothetical protein